MRRIRANLSDLALINKVLAFELFLHMLVFDFLFFLVGVHGEEYIRVALDDVVFNYIDWFEVLNLLQNSSQVLNGNLTCFVTDKEQELSSLSVIVGVNCRDRRLLFDILKVSPGEDEPLCLLVRLCKPDVQNTALVSREKQWELLEELYNADFLSVGIDRGLHLDALVIPNLNLVVPTTSGYQAQVMSVVT